MPAPEPWPSHLDALVAAPDHHRLLFENEHVRIIETRVAPGDVTPLHTHRWPAAQHVICLSDFVRRDANGEVLLDSRRLDAPRSEFGWTPPLPPHTFENVSGEEARVISVEIKGL